MLQVDVQKLMCGTQIFMVDCTYSSYCMCPCRYVME